MSKLLWITTGATLGIAAYILLKQPGPGYAGGYATSDLGERAGDATANLRSGAERLASKVSNWGTGNRLSGAVGQAGGKLEQGAANLTGDQDLADRGVLDEAAGATKSAAGKVANAVGSTIRDLNV